MRQPAAQNKPRTSVMKSFPAPTGGWVANQNLAKPGASMNGVRPPQGAAMLENYFPTATSAIMRRGSALYATLGLGTLPVGSIFTYLNGSQEEIFASNADAIYDITTILTPYNYSLADDLDQPLETDTGDTFGADSTIGLEVMTGLTGGNWIVVQFATAGGTFLRGVNGVDTPFLYDGTTFTTTPLLTFPAGDTTIDDDLSYVWVFKSRLFFIKKESLDAYYLPVDQIAGALVKFPMSGVFTRGGSLMFGASWSLDAGNGLRDTCIFVTTEGEVAVYEGGNPSDASDWTKVGVYRIGRPLGPKAFIRAGGDLVIATSIGFVPLSQAIQRDYAALSPSAVSYPIEVAWNDAVTLRSSTPWNCEVWPSQQMVVVALPTVNEQPAVMFVANSRTGAWAPFTNWDGTCLCVFKERLFFGSVDGKVVEANVTGLDQGVPYTASYVPLFDDLNQPGSLKVMELARAVFRTALTLNERVSVQTDFQIALPVAPDASPVPIGSQWGNAIWGQSQWGGAATPVIQQNWQSVNGTGYAVAPSVQTTSGSLVPLDAELIRVDATYQVADIVT